jgi:sodium-dependent dicarboxylate transporter 2/3/5
MYPNRDLKFNASKEVIQSELEKLGPTSGKEKLVLAIFGVTVFLWIFRTLINSIFPDLGLTDTMISIFAALALFSVPYSLKRGDFIIGWKDTSKLAWGILILFGGGLALGLDIPILYLLIPVTIASSCAFMLPMATPPNAIVFASGHVKIAQMARVGIILNLIAVVLLILVFQFVIPVLF